MKKKTRAKRATRPSGPRRTRVDLTRARIGRPTKYRPDYATIAGSMAEHGMTVAEIAQGLSVHLATVWRWIREHAEFRDAIKTSREVATARVEQSLYHRAVGYTHPAVKIMQNGNHVVTVDYLEHVPPDPASMIWWLKNCAPDRWREKPVEPVDDEPLKPEGQMTREEIHARLRANAELRRTIELLPATPAKSNGHGGNGNGSGNGHG